MCEAEIIATTICTAPANLQSFHTDLPSDPTVVLLGKVVEKSSLLFASR